MNISGPSAKRPGAESIPDSEPGRERASPVSPVLAHLGKVWDLTGIATGFERGPSGPAQTARSSPYKSRLGPGRDMDGLPFRCTGPAME